MSNQPFVGICGVRDSAEFTALLHRAPLILENSGHFIMAGVKEVSDELMIRGKFDMVRPFVHCDFTGQEPFEKIVERNIYRSRHFVRGLQLNVLPWMEIDFSPLWNKLKQQYPDMALILQAHRIIMEKYTPKQIVARLYGLSVDYILFDSSQSRGVAYDPNSMRFYVDAVCKERITQEVVVAGGLDGAAMGSLFAPLVQDYPALSCDAFGRLQDPVTQTLSWPRIDDYLAAWKGSLSLSPDVESSHSNLRLVKSLARGFVSFTQH